MIVTVFREGRKGESFPGLGISFTALEQHWGTEVSNAVYAALKHRADNIVFVGNLGGTTG